MRRYLLPWLLWWRGDGAGERALIKAMICNMQIYSYGFKATTIDADGFDCATVTSLNFKGTKIGRQESDL